MNFESVYLFCEKIEKQPNPDQENSMSRLTNIKTKWYSSLLDLVIVD